ncbi:MAG: cytochrome P460 family protein [Abyssibacter sp.]|uniref:cytochrome P460 family protein n=1 Tax=Abyssibacter sp. TaxID=2320200 RepID=UPI0032196CE7
MTRLTLALLAASCCVLGPGTAGTGDEASPYPRSIKMFDVPPAYADSLGDYRKRWERLTGFEYSGLHWNQFIMVYTSLGGPVYQNNYLAFMRWYEDPDEPDNLPRYQPYPVGTVVLKENFLAEGGKPTQATTVTAMIKQSPGYAPQAGDWEYLQFDAAGRIIVAGRGDDPAIRALCADCHNNMAERDYIFSQIYSAAGRD